jgi:hypothetical protein
MDRTYTIGGRYVDTGSYRPGEDQFLRWLRGPLDAGI